MQPEIRNLEETKLLGQKINMSFSGNKTFELWNRFMPRRKEIKNIEGSSLYSVEIYPENFFHLFDPEAFFEKWAAVSVTGYDDMPEGMEPLILPPGLYAVFNYRGSAIEGEKAYRYIFNEWLPSSGFELDQRPHFALMGEKYKREDPDSEEEIWIPVKEKNVTPSL